MATPSEFLEAFERAAIAAPEAATQPDAVFKVGGSKPVVDAGALADAFGGLCKLRHRF